MEVNALEKKPSSTKLYETILDWFRDQIMSGTLKKGDPLPSERELAARFGVSRVPVREALRILEYIGIVSNSPDGMVVQGEEALLFDLKPDFAAAITKEMMENLFEVRIFLESAAARCAANRRTEEDIGQMRQSIRTMLEAIDEQDEKAETMIKASHDFHFHVIDAAKNPVLSSVYRNLYDLLEVSKQRTQVSDATVMDHEAILCKIESGDAEEAGRYMRFHLERALKNLRGAKE